MANAFQARASISRWLAESLPLDPGIAMDRVALQASQEMQATEWRVFWSTEQDGRTDQSFTRLLQLDRSRGDGDEVALEQEQAGAMAVLGLATPGRGVTVPLYDYPDDPASLIGSATVRRFRGDGWRRAGDIADRSDHIRAMITLSVDYPGI